ncbi:MAG: NAD(P)H-dependent oxidoreductase subunit E [Bacilli bacterium]|jgi:NADH-quinone oxidoreductase subunit E|nr:NAD(P)H-dependent oxidoreductase subunit E [Bacilli bacterium]
MACQCNNEECFIELDKFIEERNLTGESSLIQVLHQAQHLFGYLPRNLQVYVAKKLNIPIAKVYGVVTFYTFFSETPRGENVIQVCLGTGCFVKGADKVMLSFESELEIKQGETTADNQFTLSAVRCVGACGLAPVVIINEKVYGHVQSEDVKGILENYIVGEITTQTA